MADFGARARAFSDESTNVWEPSRAPTHPGLLSSRFLVGASCRSHDKLGERIRAIQTIHSNYSKSSSLGCSTNLGLIPVDWDEVGQDQGHRFCIN